MYKITLHHAAGSKQGKIKSSMLYPTHEAMMDMYKEFTALDCFLVVCWRYGSLSKRWERIEAHA